MSDRKERACTNCGSYLHHEDNCPKKSNQKAMNTIEEKDKEMEVLRELNNGLGDEINKLRSEIEGLKAENEGNGGYFSDVR